MQNYKYDSSNSEFWNYLCGSNAATLGKFDLTSRQGVDAFDCWYWTFYPYLKGYLDETLAGAKNVLEVGLGLGTVSRYISSVTQIYSGVDVAPASTNFLTEDFKRRALQGTFYNTSILQPLPIKLQSMDAVIAIGSLHHTGDIDLAINNILSYLKPGGKACIMVYNKFSFYELTRHPIKSIYSYLKTLKGVYTWEANEYVRALNDSDAVGKAAPYTIYCHRKIFERNGINFRVELQNINDIYPPLNIRKYMLKNIARLAGTDIYALGSKNI